MPKYHFKYTSSSTNIDIDTGEVITKWNAKTNYIHLKTEKNETITSPVLSQKGINWKHIEYIKFYRKRPVQGQLF